MDKFFISTPIYYVNDVPHIGHAYTTVAADVLARWNRLNGREVFFLTGTDEHGAKIDQAAAAHNRDPQSYCDEIAGQFQAAWKALDISNDAFIRTTSPAHTRAVQAFLKILWDKGVIFKASYKGKYCVQCERFYTDDELVNGLCPDHRTTPEVQQEDNYFFRLSQFKDQLIAAIEDPEHPQHFEIFPRERPTKSWGNCRGDINDVSISRATLTWGIPLPWDRSQTTYVWVDALLNYLTAIGFPDDPSRVAAWWPAELHLMAKDILWFHAVIWPALLMAAGMALPKKIFAHGFFTVAGVKMSKSIGNVIRPDALIKEYGIDGTRYLLLSAFPFGSDGDFTPETMKTGFNAALANDLGNLVARALNMLEKYCDSKIPAGTKRDLVEQVLKDLEPIEGHLDHLQFHYALTTLLAGVDRVNRFIELKAPWKLIKTAPEETAEALREVALSLKALLFYIRPFMPQTARTMYEALGHTDDLYTHGKEFFQNPHAVDLPAGQKILKGTPIFPRK